MAVAEHVQGLGVGRRLMEGAGNRPVSSKSSQCSRSRTPLASSSAADIDQIDKSELPQRIWNECVRCPAFPICTETALIRSFEPESATCRQQSEPGDRRDLNGA